MQEFLLVELAHVWESVTCLKTILELGDRPILVHTIEKFVLEPSIEKIVVGVHGDWVSHAEDLVDKYLPLHKDRIIITKGGADRNTSIEKIIETIDAYRPLTPEDIVVTHDSVPSIYYASHDSGQYPTCPKS